MTAENWSAGRTPPCGCRRFNEAAADDRGKRGQLRQRVSEVVASMRPRPMTAENKEE